MLQITSTVQFRYWNGLAFDLSPAAIRFRLSTRRPQSQSIHNVRNETDLPVFRIVRTPHLLPETVAPRFRSDLPVRRRESLHGRDLDVVPKVRCQFHLCYILFVVFGNGMSVRSLLARITCVELQTGQGHPTAQR